MFPIGRTLCDRYVLERQHGARLNLFAAIDRRLDQPVTVELFELRDEAHEHQLREAATRFAAVQHPNVVPIQQFGRDHEWAFVVTPKVAGRSLRAVLDDGPLAVPIVAEIGRQVALALSHCHARGIVRAELELDDVFVSEQPNGLEVRLGAWLPAPLDPAAVRRGDPADPSVDLDALGRLLHACVFGRSSSNAAESKPGLPSGLEALIAALLGHRTRRPSNAREVAERLEIYTRPPVAELAVAFGPAEPSVLDQAVGRDRTLRAIDLRLTAARSGGLQLILLSGEAGIGKTTVLDELALGCQQRDFDLLRTRVTGVAEAVTDWRAPFTELLTAGLAQRPEAIERLAPIAARLISLLPDLGQVLELPERARVTGDPTTRRESSWSGLELGDSVRAPTSTSSASSSDPTREPLVAAFAALVASGRPLALAIDDAQLSLEAAAQIERLFRGLPRAPIVVLLAYRPEELGPDHPLIRLERRLAHHPRALAIELGPLTDDAHTALLGQILGNAPLESGLAAQLRRETGGSPLLARELVRTAIEAGVLIQSDEVWRLDTRRWPIPRSTRQTIESRIRRLPATTRAALEFASVLAIVEAQVERDPLRALLGVSEHELELILAPARERRLIHHHEDDPRWFWFTSEVVCRVVHDRLALGDRHKLHRHCAERLRSQSGAPFVLGSSRSPRAPQARLAITEHLVHADAVHEARPLVIALAHDALEDHQPERVIPLLLELIEIADPLAPVERGELLLLLAELELARTEPAATIAALERLAVLLDQGDNSRLTRLGEVGAELAKQLDRRDLADRLLGSRPRDRRVAERQRRARVELAALRPATSSRSMQIGDLLLMHGEYPAAREAYDTARRRAIAEGDLDEAARQLQRLARVASRLGHHEAAIGYCREGLAVLAGGRSLERVGLLALAGFAHVAADQPERAQVELDAAEIELADHDHGRDRDRVAAELERSRGDCRLALGQAAVAIDAYERCLALTPANDRWTLSIARLNLGQACALAGHANRALRELERSAADKRAIGDREGLAHAQLVRARVMRDLGQIADAAEWLIEARELADEVEDPRLSAQVQTEVGRHALLGAKLELATRAARTALDLARNSRAAVELAAAFELLASIDLARGDRDEALRHASKAVGGPPRRVPSSNHLVALLLLAEASEPDRRPELLARARAASERSANPYRELDVSLTSIRLGLGDPLHAGDDYVALEQLSDRAEALGAARHVGLCLFAQAEVLAPHDARGALDHARLGEAQLRVLGARLEADRASELIARLIAAR